MVLHLLVERPSQSDIRLMPSHALVPSVSLPSITSITPLSLVLALVVSWRWSIEILTTIPSTLLLTPTVVLLVLVLHLLSVHLLLLSLLVHHGRFSFSPLALVLVVFMLGESETTTN